VATFLLLGACGDKEQNKAQTEKFAKATGEAAARMAQQTPDAKVTVSLALLRILTAARL
jgi:hypothetical protein